MRIRLLNGSIVRLFYGCMVKLRVSIWLVKYKLQVSINDFNSQSDLVHWSAFHLTGSLVTTSGSLSSPNGRTSLKLNNQTEIIVD